MASRIRTGFWKDINNKKLYFDQLAKELKITEPNGWYKVTTNDIRKRGGTRLLQLHGNSLFKVLSTLYPSYNWKPWKFVQVPKGYWDSIDNQRKHIEEIGKLLKVETLEDWYRVKSVDFKNVGSSLLERYNNSLVLALKSLYPDFNWQMWRFERAPRNYWADPKV